MTSARYSSLLPPWFLWLPSNLWEVKSASLYHTRPNDCCGYKKILKDLKRGLKNGAFFLRSFILLYSVPENSHSSFELLPPYFSLSQADRGGKKGKTAVRCFMTKRISHDMLALNDQRDLCWPLPAATIAKSRPIWIQHNGRCTCQDAEQHVTRI